MYIELSTAMRFELAFITIMYVYIFLDELKCQGSHMFAPKVCKSTLQTKNNLAKVTVNTQEKD